jgi:hypothetical protein
MDSSIRRHKFDPLDLEILDRVYETALAHLEASDLCRSPRVASVENDGAREQELRKTVFAHAESGPVDFDTVCDKVLESLKPRQAA